MRQRMWKIITCEEHSIIGGPGEAVCSYLAETCPVPVKRIGVDDKFGCSGTAAEVLKSHYLERGTHCRGYESV